MAPSPKGRQGGKMGVTSPGRQTVDSGEHRICRRPEGVLQALLGTCVGISLVDSQAEVGGLIHLLLAEPLSTEGSVFPGRYASTGLPRFIDELVAAGADKSRLRATVAGGALIGPITPGDLNLDIGGRTTEMVERILADQGIRTDRSETGGLFACRLILDTATWESEIEPIISEPPTGRTKPAKPAPIRDRLDHPDEIKPIPQLVLRIIRMASDENYRIEELAELVKQDQVMSTNVLRFCNSSYYSRPGLTIDSIDRALVVLGGRNLLRVIAAASLQSFYPSRGGYSLSKGGLYQHAMGVAEAASGLAQAIGLVGPDVAYTAGLIHDIGKVYLDQYVLADWPLFYRRTLMGEECLLDVETEMIGLTHPELGLKLGRAWHLPDNLTDAIGYHHDPEKATHDPMLALIVYFADLYMSRFRVGLELERLNTSRLEARLNGLGFRVADFGELADIMSRHVS